MAERAGLRLQNEVCYLCLRCTLVNGSVFCYGVPCWAQVLEQESGADVKISSEILWSLLGK